MTELDDLHEVVRVLTDDDVEQLVGMGDIVPALEETFLDVHGGLALSDTRTDRHVRTSWASMAARRGLSESELRARLSAPVAARRSFMEPEALDGDPTYQFKTMVGVNKRVGVTALRVNSEVLVDAEVGDFPRLVKVPTGPGLRYTGLILLFSAVSGELLAIMQDGLLQAMRVAGTGLVGIKYLARRDATRVALIGSGGIAFQYLSGLPGILPSLEAVRVFSPTRAHRMALAERFSGEKGLTVEAVDTLDTAVAGTDIVIEATNASSPVMSPGCLGAGGHLVVNRPQAVHPECFGARSRVVVTWRGDRGDGGWTVRDYVMPVDEGRVRAVFGRPNAGLAGISLDLDATPELGEVVAGEVRVRNSDTDRTVHLNLSAAVQFTVVAAMALQGALAADAGVTLPADLFLQERHP